MEKRKIFPFFGISRRIFAVEKFPRSPKMNVEKKGSFSAKTRKQFLWVLWVFAVWVLWKKQSDCSQRKHLSCRVSGNFAVRVSGQFRCPQGGQFHCRESGQFRCRESGQFRCPRKRTISLPARRTISLPRKRQFSCPRIGRAVISIFGEVKSCAARGKPLHRLRGPPPLSGEARCA